ATRLAPRDDQDRSSQPGRRAEARRRRASAVVPCSRDPIEYRDREVAIRSKCAANGIGRGRDLAMFVGPLLAAGATMAANLRRCAWLLPLLLLAPACGDEPTTSASEVGASDPSCHAEGRLVFVRK